MKFLRRIRTIAGYSMLEMMITVGIITLVAALSGGFIVNMVRTTSDIQAITNFSMLKRELVRVVFNRVNWRATIDPAQSNTDMNCLDDPTATCNPAATAAAASPTGFLDFALYQARQRTPTPGNSEIWESAQVYRGYDPTNLTHGFDANGTPCTTYGIANSGCSYRYTLQWRPVCENASCLDPEAVVRLELDSTDPRVSEAVQKNPRRYNVELRVSYHVDRSKFTGNFIYNCPANQVVTEVRNDGSVLCTPKASF